jgi:tetratricopeptide (TPR) repeat protein
MKTRAGLVALTTGLLLNFAVAWADGPGAYRPPPSLPPPEVQAQDAYNAGVALIEKAEREEQAGQGKRANKAYERALSQFKRALEVNPEMHEALTYVGYAHRKLGRYEPALEAYGKALRLQSGFAPAIEYQGEAFLGLNRLEDAKHNYFQLYATAPQQAEKLLEAMRKWIAARRENPDGTDSAAIDTLESWVAERTALKSEQTSASGAATGW